MIMKKFYISLVFCIVFFLIPGFSVFSDPISLQITGTILAPPSSLSLSVSPTPEASDLDLSIDYVQDIGTLSATQENNTEYNVYVSSLNNFYLEHETDGAYTIPYTFVAYGGNSFSYGSSGGLLGGPISWDNDWGLAIEIEVIPDSSYPYGEYSDTLTFTIEAN
jgi:hypothetical protein